MSPAGDDDMDLLPDEVFNRMEPEQLTLYLARAGISPLDVEAALQRAQETVQEAKTEQFRSVAEGKHKCQSTLEKKH